TDPRCHDGAAACHRFEQRLAERLHQTRLCEHPALREQPRDLVVRDASEQPNAVAPFEPRPERPFTGEGERPFTEPRKGVGKPNDVLPLVERPHAEKPGWPSWHRGDHEALAVDAARDDLDLAL